MATSTDNTDALLSLSVAEGTAFELLSPSMKCFESALRDVGASPLPVLVLGEAGTGKRALALRIHQVSPRNGLPFVEAECGAAQTEASSNRISLAELLDAGLAIEGVGTVLFHEVAALDSAGQAQLRETLSDHLGNHNQANRIVPKMIFTSHRNLEQEVRLGRFREDLYYQISKICLRVPPLRHRKEDIVPLTNGFLEKYAALIHRPKPILSEATVRFLGEHNWPGNVRELEDAARAIAAIGDDKVAVAALRTAQRTARRQNGKPSVVSLKEASKAASRAAEKELILKVLSRTQWNRKRAAEELKISYKALLYKLKQIGMHEPETNAERELR